MSTLAATATPVPTLEAVRDLLASLLDRTVTLTRQLPTQALLLTPKVVLATYVSDNGQLPFALVADLGFVAAVGAALAMIPPAVATEAIAKGEIPETIMLNAYEVLNIGASLFNRAAESSGPNPATHLHVRLDKMVAASREPALLKRIQTASIRVRSDWSVVIPSYPNGKIGILALK
jgi:hypothetical protein